MSDLLWCWRIRQTLSGESQSGLIFETASRILARRIAQTLSAQLASIDRRAASAPGCVWRSPCQTAREVRGESREKFLGVPRTLLAPLLDLDDPPPHFPIRGRHHRVDGPRGPAAGGFEQSNHADQHAVIGDDGRCGEGRGLAGYLCLLAHVAPLRAAYPSSRTTVQSYLLAAMRVGSEIIGPGVPWPPRPPARRASRSAPASRSSGTTHGRRRRRNTAIV